MTYNIDDIYKSLLDCINFEAMDEYGFNEDTVEDFFDTEKVFENWSLSCGATKAVFIPRADEAQYVIKIPFDRDCDGEFEYAWYSRSKMSGWDYCKAEMEMYEEAAMVGLRDFFAETALLTEVDGWPVYISERCDFGRCKEVTDKSREQAERLIKAENIYTLTLAFMENIITEYSYHEIFELVKFIDEHNINDLRDANWGFIREYDYRPVITDYSGYNEDCW